MSDELFPAASVAGESPRLAWMRRYGVRTHHAAHLSEDEHPWCAWFPSNDVPSSKGGIPNNPDECGYGATELAAIANLAQEHGVRLWNEELTRVGGGE